MKFGWARAGLVAGALGAAGLVAWSLMPQPIPVETAKVIRGRFVATVDEDGKTRVRERYVVAAPLSGRLERVAFKVGDAVARGDTLAIIEPSPSPLLDARSRRSAEERVGAAEAVRERTRAAVERAQAQATQANAERDRTRTLLDSGATTTQALERAELALRVADRDMRAAEFQDHVAEHEINQANALLARYDREPQAPAENWTVTAPVAGVVLRVLQESETAVTPGMALLEIGDPHDLEVVVDVLSTDAVEIAPGAEVALERWGGSAPLAGRVRRVEPAAFTKVSTLGVEEQRVNVIIDVVSPPELWRGLGDGYRVEARIVVFTRDPALVVPTGALFRTGPQWQVFVVAGNRVELRDIVLLRRSGAAAAVAQGLQADEEVVVYPGDRIRAGSRVRRL